MRYSWSFRTKESAPPDFLHNSDFQNNVDKRSLVDAALVFLGFVYDDINRYWFHSDGSEFWE